MSEGRGERARMFLPNWIRRGGEGKVYVEQGSLPVFIRRNRCSKVGVESRMQGHIRETGAGLFPIWAWV